MRNIDGHLACYKGNRLRKRSGRFRNSAFDGVWGLLKRCSRRRAGGRVVGQVGN